MAGIVGGRRKWNARRLRTARRRCLGPLSPSPVFGEPSLNDKRQTENRTERASRLSPAGAARTSSASPSDRIRDSLPGANAILRIISAARCPPSLGGSPGAPGRLHRDVDEHGIPTEDWVSRVDDPVRCRGCAEYAAPRLARELHDLLTELGRRRHGRAIWRHGGTSRPVIGHGWPMSGQDSASELEFRGRPRRHYCRVRGRATGRAQAWEPYCSKACRMLRCGFLDFPRPSLAPPGHPRRQAGWLGPVTIRNLKAAAKRGNQRMRAKKVLERALDPSPGSVRVASRGNGRG